MSKNHKEKNKRENFSYEEKIKIMYRYLQDNNAFETGIRARTKFEGYPIGQWQANMRKEYYKGNLKLDKALEENFIELGILRKEKERETADRLTWDEKYIIMEEYLKSGNKIIGTTVYKGYQIGQWQATIRYLSYKGNLTTVSPELKKKLFESGILKKEKGRVLSPGTKKMSYDKKFEIMYQYLESKDFEEEIHQKTTFKGHDIGVWQDNLRQTYRKGRDLEIDTELMNKLFNYGILREEDKIKRKSRISQEEEKTIYAPLGGEYEIEQLVEILLRKQEERKALDAEIAQLQEKIEAKNKNILEI